MLVSNLTQLVVNASVIETIGELMRPSKYREQNQIRKEGKCKNCKNKSN